MTLVFPTAARKSLPFTTLVLALLGVASRQLALAGDPRHVPRRDPAGNLTGQLTNLRGGRGACCLEHFRG